MPFGLFKYHGRMGSYTTDVMAYSPQEARLEVARKYQRLHPNLTIARILTGVSVRRADW